MAISIPIMFVSLATAITLVICCFKSDCPLYDTCSGSYKARATQISTPARASLALSTAINYPGYRC